MAAKVERTFIAIKPDGVQRGLIGDIVKRFEQKGFRLVALKFLQVGVLLCTQVSIHVNSHLYMVLRPHPLGAVAPPLPYSSHSDSMMWSGINGETGTAPTLLLPLWVQCRTGGGVNMLIISLYANVLTTMIAYIILLMQASEDLLKQHYIDLKDRPFYPGLVKYMNSGPVVAMVREFTCF